MTTHRNDCPDSVQVSPEFSSATPNVPLNTPLNSAAMNSETSRVQSLTGEIAAAPSRTAGRDTLPRHPGNTHGADDLQGPAAKDPAADNLPPPCLQQQELIADVQVHLAKISALSKGISNAVANSEDETSARLDTQIENELGLKERAMG